MYGEVETPPRIISRGIMIFYNWSSSQIWGIVISKSTPYALGILRFITYNHGGKFHNLIAIYFSNLLLI
jgi:hypothetical protein